ncbi:MAG: DUF4091 domain-containing protein [Firmicutes bacterium]|nr:DUF4091 domain-containing protein [Bacillota bacterium]
MNIETRILSSMEKVFPTKAPAPMTQPMTCLLGENYAFQIAVRPDAPFTRGAGIKVSVNSALSVSFKQVGYVPAQMLYVINNDGHFLTDEPGIFPDPLFPAKKNDVAGDAFTVAEASGDEVGTFRMVSNQWNSFMVEVRPENVPAGIYPIDVLFEAKNIREPEKSYSYKVHTEIEVIGAKLPEKTFKYTNWFHGDCLADYYHVPVFSEEHWKAMRAQIEMVAYYGQTMILMPVFTPPLDTAIGWERTTIQLVDVIKENGQYSFNFDKLTRFIAMAKECGIKYFEISHLFTQWGGKCCPKVMATVDGEYKKLFGWEQEALSDEYKDFLSVFLPELVNYLNTNGLHDCTYFHLTDEPHGDHLPQYMALKEFVAPMIDPYPIMDAMSDYSYFEQGVCKVPVVATSALEPFLTGKRPDDFWVYYCIGQGHSNLSNRFMAMPGYRTRILGVQLYLENVAGFLQWGMNFYNSVQSLHHINPYAVTDGEVSFPAGDSFIIYPGEDETAVASQRLIIFGEALQDLQALKLLESLTSREHVIALIQEDVVEPITFHVYPTGESYLLNLRDKVNKEIKQLS